MPSLPPVVEALVGRYGAEPFLSAVNRAGCNAKYVVRCGLPLVAPVIGDADSLKRWLNALVEIAGSAAEDADIAWIAVEAAFEEGLSAIVGLIRRFGPDPFIQIAKAAKSSTWVVFHYGVARIADQIGSPEALLDKEALIDALRAARLAVKLDLGRSFSGGCPGDMTEDRIEGWFSNDLDAALFDPDRLLDPAIERLEKASLLNQSQSGRFMDTNLGNKGV